jgi:hypothetical protein
VGFAELAEILIFTRPKQYGFMPYIVETTETFEKEFKKKHRDKIEWLKNIKDKLYEIPLEFHSYDFAMQNHIKTTPGLWETIKGQTTWNLANKNRSL